VVDLVASFVYTNNIYILKEGDYGKGEAISKWQLPSGQIAQGVQDAR
jgi:hypothetical protein